LAPITVDKYFSVLVINIVEVEPHVYYHSTYFRAYNIPVRVYIE